MSKPDAPTKHDPRPEYIKELIAASGLTQLAASRAIVISERAMRYYMSGERDMSYGDQYTLEALARYGRRLTSSQGGAK